MTENQPTESPEQTKRQHATAIAKARHARGLCWSCAQPAEPGRARCRACADKANAASKAWYARKHAKPMPTPAPVPEPQPTHAEAFPRQEGAEVVAEFPKPPSTTDTTNADGTWKAGLGETVSQPQPEPMPTAQPEPPTTAPQQ